MYDTARKVEDTARQVWDSGRAVYNILFSYSKTFKKAPRSAEAKKVEFLMVR